MFNTVKVKSSIRMNMKYQRKLTIGFVVFCLGITTNCRADEQTAEQALDSCMQKTMVKGAALGAVGGAILGALFGGKDKAKTAAIGAALGGVAGGAVGWQTSLKSCSQSLNLVSLKSIQTEDYKTTAARYNYSGSGVFLKIEDGSVTSPVMAGQILNANLKFALLTPDGLETEVTVDRVYKCGNTEIPVKQERYKVVPGTIESKGEILMASLSSAIGEQQCVMYIAVSALGQKQVVNGNFVIQPNKP